MNSLIKNTRMVPADFAFACERIATTLRDTGIRREMACSNLIPSVSKSLNALMLPLSLISTVTYSKNDEIQFVDDENFPSINDCSGWSIEDIIVCAKDACRVLRNLCAGCEEAQERIRKNGCLRLLMTLLRICSSSHIKEPIPVEELKVLHRTCLQVIGNSVASNTENARVVWADGWPFPLLDIMIDGFDLDLKIVSLMIVYNCMLRLPESLRELAHSEEFSLILENFLCVVYRTSPAPLSGKELQIMKDASEWTQLIVHLLVVNGFFIPVHQRISMRQSCPSEQPESSETLLLFLVEDLISEGVDENSNSKTGLRLSETDCGYIAQEFSLILAICRESASCPKQMKDSSLSRLTSRLMQFIELIATVTTDPGIGIRRAMREKGLLLNVIELLKSALAAGPSGGMNKEAAAAHDFKKISTDLGSNAFQGRGLKRDLVRVIANMCYQDRESQDAVRELGGIPLVLSCTCIDENNPYSREWSIVAVRNLCENNLHNQKVHNAACPPQSTSLASICLAISCLPLPLASLGSPKHSHKLRAVR
jgi:hypothetical protein